MFIILCRRVLLDWAGAAHIGQRGSEESQRSGMVWQGK